MALLETFSRGYPDLRLGGLIPCRYMAGSTIGGELKVLQEDLTPLMEANYAVAILCGGEKGGPAAGGGPAKAGAEGGVLPGRRRKSCRGIS